MLETADRLVPEVGEPAVQQYQLLVGALKALGEGTTDGIRPPTMILDSYLLRALAIAGYAPSFSHCARCGVVGPHQAFSHSRRRGLRTLPTGRVGATGRSDVRAAGRAAGGPLGRDPRRPSRRWPRRPAG